MTTILPAARSPWQVLDQQIGQQISQNLPGAVERGMERGQIQKGLGQLSESNPQLKPLLDMLSSVAGTRQGAQYAEAIMPEIAKIMQSNQQTAPGATKALESIQSMLDQRNPSIELPGFGQKQQEPQYKVAGQQLETPQPTFDQVSGNIEKKMGEQYFPYAQKAENVLSTETKRPQKPLRPPKPIGPTELNKMRSELRKDGVVDPKLQDQYIDQFIQNQKEQYAAAKEGFENLKDYQEARTKEDDRFFKAVDPALKETFPGMGPEEENIWKGIARTNEDIGSDEARFRDTNQRYNQMVEQPLAAFTDTGPSLPYFSALKPEAVADAVSDSRSMIQDHLKSIENTPTSEQFPKELKGEVNNYLRKKYRTEMLAKDFGVAQAAYAVSNLSDKTKKSLDSIPKYPEPSIHRPKIGLSPVPDKIREELTNKLAERLKNLGPEDSLILARDYAIQNRYPDEIFNRALNMAIKDGLYLSDFQRQERPELSIPQRMDLNSVLRGKRNVFDLFKGKK